MKTHGLESILAEHPFFRELPAEYVKLLAGCSSNVRFDEGAFLFREGEEADRFYVIREGTVALELYSPGKGPLVIETIHEGGIVGWSWLIPPNQWKFDGVASTSVRALAFDGICLRKKCEEDPVLGFKLLKQVASDMGHTLDSARVRLLDMYAGKKR
jgi:CRP-like cAMP-binding protein